MDMTSSPSQISYKSKNVGNLVLFSFPTLVRTYAKIHFFSHGPVDGSCGHCANHPKPDPVHAVLRWNGPVTGWRNQHYLLPAYPGPICFPPSPRARLTVSSRASATLGLAIPRPEQVQETESSEGCPYYHQHGYYPSPRSPEHVMPPLTRD